MQSQKSSALNRLSRRPNDLKSGVPANISRHKIRMVRGMNNLSIDENVNMVKSLNNNRNYDNDHRTLESGSPLRIKKNIPRPKHFSISEDINLPKGILW